MEIKEYEKLMNKRFVVLEKELVGDMNSVSVTENGYQWLGVFRGRKEHCQIIVDAYKKIGYKKKSTPKVQER